MVLVGITGSKNLHRTPPYIGFLMNNVAGSDKLQGWCDFFRVYDDYEFYYPPSGSLVDRTLA